MPFSETLAKRIRVYLTGKDVTEKRMFGSLCFMVNGSMCVCAGDGEMLCRIGESESIAAARHAGVRPMVMRNRTAKDFVFVDEKLLQHDTDFAEWMDKALAFNKTLHQK